MNEDQAGVGKLAAALRYGAATFREVRHGALLKLFAVGSRLLFLLFVVPALVPGELTLYVFLSSVAVIAARLLGCGFDEQLPLMVSGKIETLRKFTPVVDALIVVQFVLACGVAISGAQTVALMLLTVCYVTTSFLAGLIRTVRVTGSERLRDLHWIAFGIVALVTPVQWSAVNLVLLMAACLMLVHFVEIRINTRTAIPHALHLGQALGSIRSLAGPLRLSWRKLIASAAMTLMIRSIILWPRALGVEEILDDIAYALLLGEAFMQTSMILVYRKYARYCAQDGDFQLVLRDSLRTVAMLLAYSGVAALVAAALALTDFEISGFSNWSAVAWMILFFGLLSGYTLMRYVVWVQRDFDWWLTLGELLLVGAQGLIVYSLPTASWPAALALCTAVLLIGTIGFIWLTSKGRPDAQRHA